jgi:hypothetical protein
VAISTIGHKADVTVALMNVRFQGAGSTGQRNTALNLSLGFQIAKSHLVIRLADEPLCSDRRIGRQVMIGPGLAFGEVHHQIEAASRRRIVVGLAAVDAHVRHPHRRGGRRHVGIARERLVGTARGLRTDGGNQLDDDGIVPPAGADHHDDFALDELVALPARIPRRSTLSA